MFRKIRKKVQANYFQSVLEGKKRFEVRLADFECRSGDTLVLVEQEQGRKKLTGRELECQVLFTFNTREMEKFHSKKEIEKHGLVVLSLKKKML